jgi:alpha-L-fucosidase 2
MDAYLPSAAAAVAAVILVHGGCWSGGDKQNNVAPLFSPIADAGFAWFSIDYRLACDYTDLGNGAEDVRTAVRHVREQAAEYNIDPHRIALAGESAGAHLASLAALAGGDRVSAVVSLYSPNDLRRLMLKSRLVPADLRALAATGELDDFLTAFSPVRHVSPVAPPFLHIHGTKDHIVPYEQSELMHRALLAAGVESEIVTVPGGIHGMRHWPRSQTAWLRRMTTWLGERLA